jgi:hypothetical protein
VCEREREREPVEPRDAFGSVKKIDSAFQSWFQERKFESDCESEPDHVSTEEALQIAKN